MKVLISAFMLLLASQSFAEVNLLCTADGKPNLTVQIQTDPEIILLMDSKTDEIYNIIDKYDIEIVDTTLIVAGKKNRLNRLMVIDTERKNGFLALKGSGFNGSVQCVDLLQEEDLE